MRAKSLFLLPLLGIALLGATPALAGKPQLDTGVQVDRTDIYKSAQPIADIFETKAIYGKLAGELPFDVYSFTPSKDGDQTITLLGRKEGTAGAPGLIIVDPTTATQPTTLQSFPLPGDQYHPAVLKAADLGKTYKEAALFQDFTLVGQDTIHFTKGKTFYFFIASADPYHPALHYAIKLGDGQAWKISDIFKSFGSWVRLQTDVYAGSSPFAFTVATAGFLLLLIGLIVAGGILLLHETFSFLANRSKSAGYLLVKLQPFYRAFTWTSLWFIAVGAYIYFQKVGWLGMPFLLVFIFIFFLISQLYNTFRLSPQLLAIEVTKREATIPLELRKRLFATSILSLLSMALIIILLGVYLANR